MTIVSQGVSGVEADIHIYTHIHAYKHTYNIHTFTHGVWSVAVDSDVSESLTCMHLLSLCGAVGMHAVKGRRLYWLRMRRRGRGARG